MTNDSETASPGRGALLQPFAGAAGAGAGAVTLVLCTRLTRVFGAELFT